MLNEKLLVILKMLPPEHFKRLRSATLSSFHDGGSAAEKMYKALFRYYPDFELSPKDIRKIYSKIFPGKAFNLKSLERCAVALLKTTESFLIFLRLEEDNFLFEKVANQLFLHPDLFDLFERSQAKQHEILDKREQKDADYWCGKAELYYRLYGHPKHEKYDANDDTDVKLNEASDCFYLHYKLSCSLILERGGEEEEGILLEELRATIEQGKYVNDELLNEYFSL